MNRRRRYKAKARRAARRRLYAATWPWWRARQRVVPAPTLLEAMRETIARIAGQTSPGRKSA